MFDELIRHDKILSESCEEQFLKFVMSTHQMVRKKEDMANENIRLNSELIKSNQEIRVLEEKLKQARTLLHETTQKARKAEQEKDIIMNKFDLMREMLVSDHGNTLNNDTRVKLQRIESSLSNLRGAKLAQAAAETPGVHVIDADLSIVQEIDDSTGSILDVSDLSFDATRDPTCDLEASRTRSGRQFKRKSEDILGNKRRSNKRSRGSTDRILNISLSGAKYTEAANPQLTTRKSLEKIAARRAIRKSMEHQKLLQQQQDAYNNERNKEAYNERNIDDYILPPPSAPPLQALGCWQEAHQVQRNAGISPAKTPKTPSVLRSNSNAGINSRRHLFEQKTSKTGEKCGPCGKRFGFRGTVYRCVDCKAVAHQGCKENVPMPCIGIGSAKHTPGKNHLYGLTDYTPHQPPLVPGILVHCVNELERRGLVEVGLYRVPGSEREVKELKEKFLRGKGPPNLNQIDDIHVLCGCIKDFLRGLRDTLIPNHQWSQFTQAVENPNQTESESDIFQAIADLPAANRDTLAYLILHFQRIIQCLDNKMTTQNLAKILAPTIVGYSSKDPEPIAVMAELGVTTKCMETLLNIDGDFWSGYVDSDGDNLYDKDNMFKSPKTPEAPAWCKPGGGGGGHLQDMNLGLTPGRMSNKKKNLATVFRSPFLS